MSFRYIPETRKCFRCEGCHEEDASWRVEPPEGSYLSGDHPMTVDRWLCNECYGKACYDLAVRTASLVINATE